MGGGPWGQTVQKLNLLPHCRHIHLHTAQPAVGLGQFAEFMIVCGKQCAGPPPIMKVFQGRPCQRQTIKRRRSPPHFIHNHQR